uniref:Uncharacterized protein n=1 Tax=Chromera velia CCMP2878 TaxID=1169474 RepID=A0A0G4F1F5_9ALVE|eukprot:Cvel_14516.t1-p1 / transcript=Cvel_14516.t1 / gene=Cvel_14516 / organism=Chromera_velia_CCMP2878 / gene_product=hypothetical protein / transcript_product=hypothetical protein / location=Cvel_scaffold1036:37866-38315(+) / protein_length=150 / sequence_SO=supercontig / SO=protein_coding / is_pseudo=false
MSKGAGGGKMELRFPYREVQPPGGGKMSEREWGSLGERIADLILPIIQQSCNANLSRMGEAIERFAQAISFEYEALCGMQVSIPSLGTSFSVHSSMDSLKTAVFNGVCHRTNIKMHPVCGEEGATGILELVRGALGLGKLTIPAVLKSWE